MNALASFMPPATVVIAIVIVTIAFWVASGVRRAASRTAPTTSGWCDPAGEGFVLVRELGVTRDLAGLLVRRGVDRLREDLARTGKTLHFVRSSGDTYTFAVTLPHDGGPTIDGYVRLDAGARGTTRALVLGRLARGADRDAVQA